MKRGPSATPDPAPEGGCPNAPSGAQFFELMWARRLTYETNLWQTPTILLAAQAFLLTIAFSHGADAVGRKVASGFLVALSVGSVLLFRKHRWMEVKTNRWLADAEARHSLPRIHSAIEGHPKKECGDPWGFEWSMSSLWQGLLWLSVAVSVFALVWTLTTAT